MTRQAVRAALLVSILPLAGCGTVSNLTSAHSGGGGPSPFGGVRHDLACIHGMADEEFGGRPHVRAKADAPEAYPRMTLLLLCAADLPLSLAADTVLWPYTKAYTYANSPVPYPPIVIAGTAGTLVPVATPGATPPPLMIPLPPMPNATPPMPAPTPVVPTPTATELPPLAGDAGPPVILPAAPDDKGPAGQK